MLGESRTVHQRSASGTAQKRSIEDCSDEKNCAQRSHDYGEAMQTVVGRVLTVHGAEKTGRGDRADISCGALQTGGSANLGRSAWI